ncbi:MAG TPA: glutamine-synthetase adenylyltransferase, partial [Rhodospirillales bacterium]|nr:glutamine-synthetase adenylyltransferase [Rhodospirillales bacterium]
LGFQAPKTVDATLRGWHHGRYRATRSARARELLTELGPVLLKAFCAAPDPDATLLKFDAFLSNLPAGVQLFSMLHSNPHLLELLVKILGLAPRLADHLSRHPSVLESVLTQDFFDPPPPRQALDGELDRRLEDARDIEDVLDISRRWANDRRFQIGVQSLLGHLTPAQAAWGLSTIAEAALGRLFPRIEAEFMKKHGVLSGSAMAVIAMGKLGGREMTPTSDLDLIFVYSVPGNQALSDGPKPLSPGVYFARLSQRMINALSAQTGEGILYEVDMRLRPSGNAGPIASSMDSFRRYHQEQAWTWEHMALTRARVITGPGDLKRAVTGVIRDALTRGRDGQTLVRDVAHMRARMDAEHHTDSLWDVKHLRGGLVDIEFIAQYLMLKNAHDHPEVLSSNTWMALNRLVEAGFLSPSDAGLLKDALTLWQALQGFLRLTVKSNPGGGKETDIPLPLHEILARQGRVRSFGGLKKKITVTAEGVFKVYRGLIEKPAKSPSLQV